MNSDISRLVSLSTAALSDPPSESALQKFLAPWNSIGTELADLLRHKNGFYCFHSALLLRPYSRSDNPLGLVQWNAQTLWRNEFKMEMGETLFFAEDLFGGQFCIRDNAIATFDPETGIFEPMASTLSQWATKLLADPKVLTAYPLALEWMQSVRDLPPGFRLLPKRPFVCGGTYTLDNLYALEDVIGMTFRATIATQIRDVPDGSQIIFRINRTRPSEDTG
jgi:hypothetical protein